MKKNICPAAYDGCRNCCAVHGIVSCIELHSSRGRRISVPYIRGIDNSAVFYPGRDSRAVYRLPAVQFDNRRIAV